MADATSVLHVSPVIPVVTIDDPQHAVPVARALADGGVRIIELTLRTESALTSLKLIANEVPDILRRGRHHPQSRPGRRRSGSGSRLPGQPRA